MFDFEGGDVLASSTNHVLHAVEEANNTIRIANNSVLGMEPKVSPCLYGRLGHIQVARRDAEPLAGEELASGSAGARSPSSAKSCGDEVDEFIGELREMDSRLNVGLTYVQYGDRLGDVSVAYDNAVGVAQAGELDRRCLTGAIRGEKAFNLYRKAGNVWDKCFEDLYCSNDSIERQLQKIWAKAHKRVAQAWRNLQ